MSALGSAPVGDSYKEQWKALSAWFLGPRAENAEVFLGIFGKMFEKHVRLRNGYFPSDPAYITEELKSSDVHRCEVADMKEQLMEMQRELENSVPFFSPRYQGHMNWDTTMPAVLGYMGAMLYGQNNVDSAASPVTTLFEQEVGLQLCDMLGYNIRDEKKPFAWGHVTCGGSVANIEALWASRNIKFVPLAVKAALMNYADPDNEIRKFLTKDQIDAGLDYELFVYKKEGHKMEHVTLKDCNTWQLLNLDIDVMCDLVANVVKAMEREGSVDGSKFGALVEKEGVMSIGVLDIMRKHGLKHSPVYTAPANNHYSWPKGGTLLGLGSGALIPIQLDVNFRQDVEDLRKKLEECLESETPVMSVVVVMGSTEESAVDPIAEIYNLREEFKSKGLNFALLADGAWGGYFKTMLIDSPGTDRVPGRSSSRGKYDGFVPYCELSPYVQHEYNHIQMADTITIDPHKSGFCPYPGGALCYRNKKMRLPIALYHPEVFHGEDDPTMGVYGLEGSKPGAAPAGILMSHNVIGLSNRGYGRILGQCTTTTKLFYAMWLTVARDDDPFECFPLQDIPGHWNMKDLKEMIKRKIAYQPMAHLYKDKEVKKFLKECGPDTIINTFVVKCRGKKEVDEANKLQLALADSMNVFVGKDACRVPLMIMQSGLNAVKHGKGLKHFKEKAGLDVDDKDLNVMVNSCVNPWQSNECIFAIGELFRLIVLNCIGRVYDSADASHRFMLSGSIADKSEDESIFIEYLTGTDSSEHQYQVSIKAEGSDGESKVALRKYIDYCTDKNLSVLFESNKSYYEDGPEDPNLYNILHQPDNNKNICLHLTLLNDPNKSKVALKVLDLPRYQRLDLSTTVTHPAKQKYFIYGDSTRTIMSHVISKLPDFQHTVTLAKRPHFLTETMLGQGVMAEVERIEGSPLEVDGKFISPLQRSCYEISFKGERSTTLHTTIDIKETVIFNTVDPPCA